MISLFLIAGRAQYFLQPEFQRVRAGAGDHPEGHHRHRPGAVLQQPPAADGAPEHQRTGLQQPLSQVGAPLAPEQNSGPMGTRKVKKRKSEAYKQRFEPLCMNMMSRYYPPGTV